MKTFVAFGKQWMYKSLVPILLENSRSTILEKGSLRGFITGKSYNCYRRIHETLAVVMKILHVREKVKALLMIN